MSELSLQACARATGGRLVGNDVRFSRVSTDTRTLEDDELMVALVGERFDAHDMIDQDLADRACALLVSRTLPLKTSQLLVPDTLRALGDIARLWRAQLDVPVVAITGSNGKTTVKEMTASILRERGKVFATHGNLNNEIGVPLSVFAANETHDFIVLELGANHAGEIAYLTGIANPQVAVVNNAGPSHLEGFGSLQGVADAKGEIYTGLPADGTAVVNVDDPFARQWAGMAGNRRLITFGMQNAADVSGELIEPGVLRIRWDGQTVDVALPLPGTHNAMNCLSAAGIALALDTPLDAVAAGLEKVEASSGRLNFRRGLGGSRVIDDTYNANPASLQAGLRVLRDKAEVRAVCVLGNMRELGEEATRMHRAVGEFARDIGIDELYCTGDLAREAAIGFGDETRAFDDIDALITALRASLNESDWVLVKGSRGARMERVVEAIVTQDTGVTD